MPPRLNSEFRYDDIKRIIQIVDENNNGIFETAIYYFYGKSVRNGVQITTF